MKDTVLKILKKVINNKIMSPVGVYKRKKISMICVECSKPFSALSYCAKYCDKCKIKVKRMKHKLDSRMRRADVRKARGLTCQNCGCDISEFKQCRKFCPDCAVEASYKRGKDYYLKNRKVIGEYQRNYYRIEENKLRHRVIARESARRCKINKKI